MLERYVEARGIQIAGGSLPFRDSGDTAGWARASLERFYARGLVKGDGTGRLLPTRELTRSEVQYSGEDAGKVLDEQGI